MAVYEKRIDAERRRVITTWGAIVTDASLMEYQKFVWSDSAVYGFDELIDFRALEQVEVSSAGLEAVASVAAGMDETVGQGRFAIVVKRGLEFGLSRMYASLRALEDTASRQLMIFHRPDEALAWLDAPYKP